MAVKTALLIIRSLKFSTISHKFHSNSHRTWSLERNLILGQRYVRREYKVPGSDPRHSLRLSVRERVYSARVREIPRVSLCSIRNKSLVIKSIPRVYSALTLIIYFGNASRVTAKLRDFSLFSRM